MEHTKQDPIKDTHTHTEKWFHPMQQRVSKENPGSPFAQPNCYCCFAKSTGLEIWLQKLQHHITAEEHAEINL